MIAGLGALALVGAACSSSGSSTPKRPVAKPGQIVTVVSKSKAGGGVYDPAHRASIYNGVAIDDRGTLYVADEQTPEVISVTPAGVLKRVVGGRDRFETPPDADYAFLHDAASVAVDQAGKLYIGDLKILRAIDRTGRRVIAAGNGEYGDFQPLDGPASQVKLSLVYALAVDRPGNVYIANQTTLAKLGTDGIVRTIAGTGQKGFSGDGGPATSAMFGTIEGVAFDDHSGSLYAVEPQRVRRIDAKGTVDTVAGNGQPGMAADRTPARQAPFGHLSAIVVDGVGNLFVADAGNNVVQEITTDGLVHTVAGTGRRGSAGDGGPATSALLESPQALAIDAAGNLYVIDASNRVRMVGAQPKS